MQSNEESAAARCRSGHLTPCQTETVWQSQATLSSSHACIYGHMIAVAKLALLALVALVCLALTAEARELLDYYDDCYNGAWHQNHYASTDTRRAQSCAATFPVLGFLVFRSFASTCVDVSLEQVTLGAALREYATMPMRSLTQPVDA